MHLYCRSQTAVYWEVISGCKRVGNCEKWKRKVEKLGKKNMVSNFINLSSCKAATIYYNEVG